MTLSDHVARVRPFGRVNANEKRYFGLDGRAFGGISGHLRSKEGYFGFSSAADAASFV